MLPGILKILGQGGMAAYSILATYLGIYLGMSRILKLNRKLGTLWTCLGFYGHGCADLIIQLPVYSCK